MIFANPWGLLGLLALPTIAAIHLYHRRFPPMLIAGAHLWGIETQVRTAGRRRDRLPITATFLLELLAALLLSLILSQPRFGDVGKATHLIVVLDNSASMMGTPPRRSTDAGNADAGSADAKRQSFRDAAVAELERRVMELERGSVVTLILTGRRPVMLAGPGVPWDRAQPELEQWNPSATRHEFQAAWDLAAQLAEQHGRLLFLTDRVPSKNASLPKQMEVVSVGRILDNVAISAARWTFDSDANQGHVFVRIDNLGSKSAEVLVRGRTQTGTVFRRTVAIPAGEAVPFETKVAGGLGQLTIDLQSDGDGLDTDNHVTLIEPKLRVLKLALTLPKDQAAIRLTQRVLDAIPNLEFGDVESAHLVIGLAGELPASRRDLWWLGIGPIDPSEAARKKAKDILGPYLIEKRNPLVEGIVLGGIVWGGVQPVDLQVSPLISAGSTSLLARLNGTQTTAFILNIDMARSNLSESPDWPILLSNLVELRRDNRPGLRRWNYRLNEEIRFRLFDGDSDDSASAPDLTLIHDKMTRVLARAPIVELPPLDQTGVYQIQDGKRTVGEFAINFHDIDESMLTGLRPGTRDPTSEVESAQFTLDNPYSWLIMLGIVGVILVAFFDWYVLNPRAAM